MTRLRVISIGTWADGLVSRLVFTNPFALGVQRVRLQLATQMIDVLDSERGRLIEYSQLAIRHMSTKMRR